LACWVTPSPPWFTPLTVIVAVSMVAVGDEPTSPFTVVAPVLVIPA
jgi:hypothetical protein